MKLRYLKGLLFIAAAVILLSSNALSTPVITNVSFYTEHNPNFPGSHWFYQFGGFVEDDSGLAITKVVAKSVDSNYEFVLFDDFTLTGDWKWGWDEIVDKPWLDQLEIKATNELGYTSSVLTHILGNEQPLPFSSKVVISDESLMPTFKWNAVDGADNYRVRILDSSGERIFDSILLHDNFTETFYTLPDGILEYGQSYELRLIADQLGVDSGILENRSSTFLSFKTVQAAPVPEPATVLLLGTGLIGLAGFGRKRLEK